MASISSLMCTVWASHAATRGTPSSPETMLLTLSSRSASAVCSTQWRRQTFAFKSVTVQGRRRGQPEKWRLVKTRAGAEGGEAPKESGKEAGEAPKAESTPFGYTRKDVLLIGLGVTLLGVGLKTGLEAVGLDSNQSGNVVQLVVVLGLMLAWAATYVFRVGNKEMTYVKQLKDYEDAVMKKRLDELPEAELEVMLAEVEQEKVRIKAKREKKAAEASQ
eukprot:TRINITY_DN5366_c0_g1_i1.p1 TRINITY_DN5366_c0_g1~~TRINITY_DN5366_c0_g1_i1.p1  ORF type:complete len:219 (+),score=51.55 TRINITY_DN5366_c0_g1_i1:108-764(+)